MGFLGPFTQDTGHFTTGTMQKRKHIAVKGSVHTAGKQQRICVQICFGFLCELGLSFSAGQKEPRNLIEEKSAKEDVLMCRLDLLPWGLILVKSHQAIFFGFRPVHVSLYCDTKGLPQG